MNSLDLLNAINIDQLDQKYYFKSIMEQAKLYELLSDIDISNIQNDLLIVLSEQTDKWSKGNSTSIPLEIAQDIMMSIIYVIGIQLKSYSSLKKAVISLKSGTIKRLFRNGLELVSKKIAITRHLQKHIEKNLLDTKSVFYHSTIIDGINGFFKLYDPEFSAHEMHITVDYPIFIDRPNVDGIEFIEQYLRCIKVENEFCKYFSANDIHHLLCGLIEDYYNAPLNLFEPVLLSALGLTILNLSPQKLNLSKEDIYFLYQFFEYKSNNQIRVSLEKANDNLNKKMVLPLKISQYVNLCIPKLASIIESAVMMNTLDKVFLIPINLEKKSKLMLSYGERMSDEKYLDLIDKILHLDNGVEKIKLILNKVHSLWDLLDIISDAELCTEDMKFLVDELPFTIFVSLLAQYPNDDFLERESDKLLFNVLEKKKSCLSIEEKNKIAKTLKTLHKEDI